MFLGIAMGALFFLTGMLFVCILSSENEDCALVVFIIIAMLTAPAGVAGAYLVNYSEMANLESFYDANLSAYEYTIEKTQAIEIAGADAEFETFIDTGGLTYLKVGEITAERVLELRNQVKEYNKAIAHINRQNRHLLLGLYYPELPERLTYIKLGE